VLHQPKNGGLKCPHLLQSKQCRGEVCYEDEVDVSDVQQTFATTLAATTTEASFEDKGPENDEGEHFRFRSGREPKQKPEQGDQIGRIFAFWRFLSLGSSLITGVTSFSTVKG
jgi:hypothetical protein